MSATNSRFIETSVSTANGPPPISELWPDFGITVNELPALTCKADSIPMTSLQTNRNSHDHHETRPTGKSAFRHNNDEVVNSNYVNFNQFIRQHNLVGVNGDVSAATSQLYIPEAPQLSTNAGFFSGDSIWAPNSYEMSSRLATFAAYRNDNCNTNNNPLFNHSYHSSKVSVINISNYYGHFKIISHIFFLYKNSSMHR